MKYLIFCSCLWFFMPFHGGHMAEYYYQLDGKDLNLKFVIDKEELMNFKFRGRCDIHHMTALCAVKYLNRYSSIKINDKKIKMRLQNSHTEGGHLIIQLSGTLEDTEIKEITIQNKCFFEFDNTFHHRIIMDVAQFQKSYLLNRVRTKIELN